MGYLNRTRFQMKDSCCWTRKWFNSTSSERGGHFGGEAGLLLYIFHNRRCAHLTKTSFLIQGKTKPKFSTLLSHTIKRDMKRGMKTLTFISHQPCTRGSPKCRQRALPTYFPVEGTSAKMSSRASPPISDRARIWILSPEPLFPLPTRCPILF